MTTKDALIIELQKLRREIRISNSFQTKFLGGLFNGLGTVLGATVLVAFLIFILSQLSSIEFLRPLIENITTIVTEARR